MEFENRDVISYNNSEQFYLDIQYTKGEYYFILNPLTADKKLSRFLFKDSGKGVKYYPKWV